MAADTIEQPERHDSRWMDHLPPKERTAAKQLGFGSQTRHKKVGSRRTKSLPPDWRATIWALHAGTIVASKEVTAARLGLTRKGLYNRLKNPNDELTIRRVPSAAANPGTTSPAP